MILTRYFLGGVDLPRQAERTAKPLSQKDHDLLSYIEQMYLLHGAVPTKEKCIASGKTNASHYSTCLKSPDFRHAMLMRGITLVGFSETPAQDLTLTEEQLVTANIMLDLRDNRSQKNKLKDCGVSSAKWEGWLRDPAFQSYIRQRAENLLGDNIHESHLALVDRVRSGDINAIKYFNEITGRYTPQGNDKADVNAVLMMVLEVLQRRLSNEPELLAQVADDLLAIGRKQNPMASARVIEMRPVAPELSMSEVF